MRNTLLFGCLAACVAIPVGMLSADPPPKSPPIQQSEALDEPAGPPGQAVDQQGFEKHAEPFLETYCYSCHGEVRTRGGYDFLELSLDMSAPEAGETWSNIFAQVQFSEMPPSDRKTQPSAEEKRKFLDWLDGELTRYGRGFGLDEKLLLPEFGNYIDHASLFDGSVTEEPYTPARLWRQRPTIYDSMWGSRFGRSPWMSYKIGSSGRQNPRDVVQHGPHKGKTISTRYFNTIKYANPFYEFVHHASGFTDYATIRADMASLEALLTNGEAMAEVLTEGVPVTVVQVVKNKDSRHGNNEAGFVGGVETRRVERTGLVPVIFKKIVDTEGPIDRADFDHALEVAFSILLRRTPRDHEPDHYWEKVFQRNAPLGNKMALQATLIYIALTPEFVYRMEMGMGEPDEHGRRMLSPHELVHAIHHAFEDSQAFGVDEIEMVNVFTGQADPVLDRELNRHNHRFASDNWLVEQMKAGELKTREDVERAVRRYLDQPPRTLKPNHNSPAHTVRNPRILRFFREYFGYHKAKEVFKDVDTFVGLEGFQQFRGNAASQMIYDTDTLVLHILQEDKDVLYELLTTNKVFTAYWSGSNPADQVARARGKDMYAAVHHLQSYNLDPFEQAYEPVRGKGPTPLYAPKDQRCGVLTQPSWLVAHSQNFDNDPVRRGKWVREHLLAGTVLDVPINVDARVPDDEHATLRERFAVTREDACWRCHKKMNPLGMPFEAFNHVGRFRETELGKPTDTSGAIGYTIDESIEGDIENVRQMMEKIARSDLARQSFIRHVFRYWMGRNEMLSDSKTLIAMDKAYVESGGSFNELLVALLTSDSFLYRK